MASHYRKPALNLTVAHWLVVGFSLTLTIIAWQVSSSYADSKSATQFEFQTDQIVSVIQDRVSKYENVLWGGVGMIQSHEEALDHSTWKAFSDSLALQQRLPGINGVGVIFKVEPENVDTFIREQQKARPYFTIHPEHSREEFWPITYIEPERINLAAVGLDMAHEDNRYNAAVGAMRTGKPQITAPIALVQDFKRTPGFLLFVPFNNHAQQENETKPNPFLGLVYAPFIMSKLMQGTVVDSRYVDFTVSDEGEILFSSTTDSPELNNAHDPSYTREVTLSLYGRDWEFDFQSTPSFDRAFTSTQPMVVLIAGLIIDALILGVFYSLSRAARAYEKRCSELDNALSQQKNRCEALIDSSHEPMFLLNAQFYVQSANKAAKSRFGDGIVGSSFFSIFAQEDADLLIDQWRADGSGFDMQATAPNGVTCVDLDGQRFRVKPALEQRNEGPETTTAVSLQSL